jgi:hypothetical protein
MAPESIADSSLTLATDAKAIKKTVFYDKDKRSVLVNGSKLLPRTKLSTKERSHVGITLDGRGLSIAMPDNISEIFLSLSEVTQSSRNCRSVTSNRAHREHLFE